MRRGKRIAIIAGLGAVLLVGGIVGNYWKEIYFVLYPEARFWGRWEIVGTDETPKPIFVFGKNGKARSRFAPPVEADDFSTLQKKEWSRLPRKIRLLGLKTRNYRVFQNRIVFSHLGDTDGDGFVERRTRSGVQRLSSTVTAKYRFDTEGVLTLEFEHKGILGYEKTMTLRRLPES